MGNCCGSESKNFAGEGRTLGAQPANAPPRSDNARAAAPPKISGPQGGRTLGKNSQAPGDSQDPKAAAARAAEVRSFSFSSMFANPTTGVLAQVRDSGNLSTIDAVAHAPSGLTATL